MLSINMAALVRIGNAASMLGACTRTIRRRDAVGLISCAKTRGGHQQAEKQAYTGWKIGRGGFEPPATRSQTGYHTRLDHLPIVAWWSHSRE